MRSPSLARRPWQTPRPPHFVGHGAYLSQSRRMRVWLARVRSPYHVAPTVRLVRLAA